MTRFFLLAAGLGVRARPLSNQLAKPAFPLAGRPFIARLLAPLSIGTAMPGFVNVCHLPGTVRAAIPAPHPPLAWIEEKEPTGSLVLRQALDADWDRLPALHGATWLEPPLAELHRVLDGSDAAALLVRPDPQGRYTSLTVDEAGALQMAPPRSGGTMYAGTALLTRPAVAAIESRNFIADLAARRLPVRLVPYAGPWLDGGTPALYLEANLDFIARAGLPDAALVSPGARVDRAARVTRSVVWPGAEVPAQAVLDECLVMGGAAVPRGPQRRMLFSPAGANPLDLGSSQR